MSDDYKENEEDKDMLTEDLPENPEDWDQGLSTDDDTEAELDDADDADDADEMENLEGMDDAFGDDDDEDSDDETSEESSDAVLQSPAEKKKKLMILGGLAIIGTGVLGAGAYKMTEINGATNATPAPAPAKIQSFKKPELPKPSIEDNVLNSVKLAATPVQDRNTSVKAALMAKVKENTATNSSAMKNKSLEFSANIPDKVVKPSVVTDPVVSSQSLNQPLVDIKAQSKVMTFQEKFTAQRASKNASGAVPIAISKPVPKLATSMTEESIRDIVRDELKSYKSSQSALSKKMSDSIQKLDKGMRYLVRDTKKNTASFKKLDLKVQESKLASAITKPASNLKQAKGFNVINTTGEGNMSILMTPTKRIIVVFVGERVRINGKTETVTDILDGGNQVVFSNKYFVNQERVEKKKAVKVKSKKAKPKKKARIVKRKAFYEVKLAMLVDNNEFVIETANGDFRKVKVNEKIPGYEHLGYVKGYKEGKTPGLSGRLLVGDKFYLNTKL